MFPFTSLTKRSWIGFLMAACAGCSKGPAELPSAPPPAVSTCAPIQNQVTDYHSYTGRTAAVMTIQIRARTTGYLESVSFKDGDLVNARDVLCVIDPRVYQAAFDQAEANVAQYDARVQRLQGDYERNRGLFMKGGISREEFDKFTGDLKEGQASLNSAKAALVSAKLNLDFTRVAAPVSGRVSRRNVDPGNLVKADDTIITTIVTQDPMYVYFDIDDQTYLQLEQLVRERKAHFTSSEEILPTVQVGLSNEKSYPHTGTIDFVDNQVDPGTGTMRMRGVFPNKDGRLKPGLFVRVRVPMGNPHPALLVTDRAIDTDQGQKVIYVVNKDKVVEKRDIVLGGLHDNLREIVSGVKAGEQVVVDGIQRVRGGSAVNPKQIDMPGVEATSKPKDK